MAEKVTYTDAELHEAFLFEMPFGKYRGKMLGEIVNEGDFAYLDWLNGIEWRSSVAERNVRIICDKFEAEIDSAIGDSE